MVRSKNTPTSHSQKTPPPEMALVKCQVCDLALNRPGEKRPGTRCKDCKKDHCFKCAEVTGEFCETMREMGKDFWQCKKCESKGDDMKTVI